MLIPSKLNPSYLESHTQTPLLHRGRRPNRKKIVMQPYFMIFFVVFGFDFGGFEDMGFVYLDVLIDGYFFL